MIFLNNQVGQITNEPNDFMNDPSANTQDEKIWKIVKHEWPHRMDWLVGYEVDTTRSTKHNTHTLLASLSLSPSLSCVLSPTNPHPHTNGTHNKYICFLNPWNGLILLWIFFLYLKNSSSQFYPFCQPQICIMFVLWTPRFENALWISLYNW